MSIEQLIPEGFCLSCQGCCRFSQPRSSWTPHLLREEEKTLGEIAVTQDLSGSGFICGRLRPKDNICSIYGRRPFECQLYPFLLRRKDNRAFLALDPNCSYVSQNRNPSRIKEFTRTLYDRLQTAEYREKISNNPQLFQEYDGVLDIVELKIKL